MLEYIVHNLNMSIDSNSLILPTEKLACAESYEFLGIAIVASPLKFTIEFRHSWHSQIFNALLKNQ